jgi:hypothetical protein
MSTPDPQPVNVTLPAARAAVEWSNYDHMNGPDGGIHPVETCSACRHDVRDGDPMRKVGNDWLHEACALARITAADGDAAWLILADQVVARPSAFRATDIKVIMRNVSAIARRAAQTGGE